MFSLIHLIFEFFRITILSCIYGFIVNLIFKSKKIKLPIIVGFLFLSLFIWRFSYWRNNGFGDSYRVALSSKYEIKMIDLILGEIYYNGSPIITVEKIYCNENIIYIKNNKTYSIIELENEKTQKNLSINEFKKKKGEINKLQSLEIFHSTHHNTFKLLFF